MSDSAHPGAAALAALSKEQKVFLQNLPKAELHAHLNGSIPLECLQELARKRQEDLGGSADHISSEVVRQGLERLERGVTLEAIEDFFTLFPAIYTLTSTPDALRTVTRAVLDAFLAPSASGEPPQCQYIELRTGPRKTEHMSRRDYLLAVLDEVERFPPEKSALIVSVDRQMTTEEALECIEIAHKLKVEGRRVVGVDLCGDPSKGDVDLLLPAFQRAKQVGLSITLHIAETLETHENNTLKLLSAKPDRLGHATFLDETSQHLVATSNTPIEICLTSNLLCKSVKSLDDHHIRYWLALNHPIAICTDDILPFRTTMLMEYALLLAPPPLGLGLTNNEVERIAKMSMESRFHL